MAILTNKQALKNAKEVSGCKLKVLGHYKNGNHYETIFEDGTRVRQTIDTEDDRLLYEFPSNFDLKITNMCPVGCKYCHESSTPNGVHGDILNMRFIDTLVPGTEVAIGGGSALSHPDLIPFLKKLKKQGALANITVNQKELMRPELATIMKNVLQKKLVHGVGVSLTDNKTFNKVVDDIFGDYPNLVVHTIAGIFDGYDLPCIKGRKMLILGYKDLKGRRAGDYYDKEKEVVETKIKLLKEHLPDVFAIAKLVSFDCLAIKQLDPKEVLGLSDEDWDLMFQGDDYASDEDKKASSTLYIDAVTRTVARASTHPLNERVPFSNENITELFAMSKAKSTTGDKENA